MSEQSDRTLAEVVRRAAQGKYEDVCPALVRRIAARELAVRGRPKEVIKATRRKLHQVGAAYWHGSEPSDRHYVEWLGALRQAITSGPAALRDTCRTIMASHASTAERLPLLGTFYQRALEPITPVSSVLDLGCGLNPLTAPWMPLAEGASYHAYDIYSGLMAFLGEALPLLGMQSQVGCEDVLAQPPNVQADLALLLKVLPLVEQLWGEPAAFLQAVNAPYLLVSFPVATLSGRSRGMRQTYAQRFEALLGELGWAWEAHPFEAELAYLVHKG